MSECLSLNRQSTDNQLFMGREWVFCKIGKTLDMKTPCVHNNVTAILGCAGSGKSFLLQQMFESSRYKNNLLAFFECHEYTDVHQFIVEIELQIKEKVNIKSSSILSDAFDKEEETLTNDDVFRHYVMFPLLEAQCPLISVEEQRYLIAIDSIDVNGDICQLVSNHIHLLPKWLHLIVTARPKRRKGFTKMFSGARKIVIDDMRKVNVINDMKSFIMYRIKQMNCGPLGPAGKKALNQIGIKSNGCFLYVKLVLDCFEQRLLSIDQVDEIGATLNGLYLALCSKLFDAYPQYETDYKLILSVIMASRESKIRKDLLQNSFEWNDIYLETRLNELCLYCMIQMKESDIMELNHWSLIEWITDVKHCTRRFLCEKSAGHILLALKQTSDPMERHYHILNSDINGFEMHHYALWLLINCSIDDLELISENTEDSPIIDFIDSCKDSFFTTHLSSHVDAVKCMDSVNPWNASKSTNYHVETLHNGIIEDDSLEECNHLMSEKLIGAKVSQDDSDLINCFHRSIINGDMDSIRNILCCGSDVGSDLLNSDCIKQKTALFWAIKSAKTEIVELLIELDVDVNAVCDEEEGVTPLMLAVSHNLIDVCELLLDADADVDACDKKGYTPLVHAIASHSSPKIIELLLFWGSHTDFMDEEGRSLLCLAANESQCSVESIRLLLAVGCDELHKDNYGRTALHLASARGNADVVEALLDIGGDALLLARDNEGKLALHESAAGGFLNACRLLCSPQTMNVLSHDGKSALRLAALHSHLDVITLLVECGADINYVDADGRTTVYCVASVCDANSVACLKHLSRLGADLEAKDLEGRTALHVAAWQGLKAIVETLIGLQANVNAVDAEGRTPLHMCAWNGHTDVVSVLIDAGCDVNHISSTQGASPLLIAAQQGHIDACLLLLNAGSDATHVDLYGRNAQDVANNCGHRDIAILLESHLQNPGDSCPTLSSHASTAETAAIGEIDTLSNYTKCHFNSHHHIDNKRENNRKHKKMMSISKFTKLLH